MKKILILLLLIFAIVFSLASCGESQTPTGGNGGETPGDTENNNGGNSDAGNSDGGDSEDNSNLVLPTIPF